MDAWEYDGFRFDTIYQGTASSTGTYNFTFPTGKSITSYKQLVFFVDGYYTVDPLKGWITKNTIIVEPKENNVICDYSHSYQSDATNANNWWTIYFSVNSASQFRIDATNFGSAFSAVRVYKVIGLY